MFVLNSIHVVGDVTTKVTVSFPGSLRCSWKLSPFEELLQSHQAVAKEIPYLIAKVEEASGAVFFADGIRAAERCSNYYAFRSLSFFALVETTAASHLFREVLLCSRPANVRENMHLLNSFNPHAHMFRIERIRSLLQVKQYEEANSMLRVSVDILFRTMSKEKECLEALLALGKLVYGDEAGIEADWALEKRLYEHALAQDPRHEEARVRLADLFRLGNHQIKKDFLRAKELLEEVLERNPYNPEACALLAEVYSKGGEGVPRDRKKAEELYLKAIERCPNYGYALGALGELYRVENKPQMAEERFLQALAFDSNDVFCLSGLAQLYQKQDPEKARSYADQALARDPKDDLALSVKLELSKITQ